MRKLVILTIIVLLSINSFAQRQKATFARPVNSVEAAGHFSTLAAKTTAIGDTSVLSNISPAATLTIYRSNSSDTSGYATGTNVWNDMGFAELYTINGRDSSVTVLGVFAEFSGTVNPASGKTVTFDLWGQAAQDIVSTTISYNGFPGGLLDTASVPITQLGIGATTDTLKEYLFSAPSTQKGPFFVGYSINYNYSALNGDTIGLACTVNGNRTGDSFIAKQEISDFGDTTNDTIINVQNATQGADFTWYDNYTQNDSLFNNLAIFPIVAINVPSGVKGITRNNLTFFGNYPNPAKDNTNIKFSLATGRDVTIQIMDMSGRILNTIQQPNLAAGMHIIPVNTTGMPSGDYLYLIRTSGGDGMAGKMTVTP